MKYLIIHVYPNVFLLLQFGLSGGMDGESSRNEMKQKRSKRKPSKQRHWESESSDSDSSFSSRDLSDGEPEADYPMTPRVSQQQFGFVNLSDETVSDEVKDQASQHETNSNGQNSINSLTAVADDKSLDLNL